ncbi:MAG: hypothetical protein GWN61_09385 [candidate division Zixibacteria bacterium]|nr:hypothetical protein [candidate division Zixibacteria bacterium]NIS46211.1 hypothetical protein [candidate division Zixibacteria bacterium]NIU14312.1 hypothetical protein [candidate division Zixibacteria bacterium]NIV06377.1 hypothetical protein [candidate division Zixibacteria bacterium]
MRAQGLHGRAQLGQCGSVPWLSQSVQFNQDSPNIIASIHVLDWAQDNRVMLFVLLLPWQGITGDEWL